MLGNPQYDDMLPLQAFLHMMPLAQLALMLDLTNMRLDAKEKQKMTLQELLWWIDVCVLTTSINFSSKHCKLLEGCGSISKYLPSYDLCVMVMSRNRFDNIWYAVRWSQLLEQYRWMLVNNFVTNINKYCARTFVPGNHLEADKTVIQWYGVGGTFVDAGFPMHRALKRKPNNVGKI